MNKYSVFIKKNIYKSFEVQHCTFSSGAWEKVRHDVTDYKLKLKISECMLVNFEFLILIGNFEF